MEATDMTYIHDGRDEHENRSVELDYKLYIFNKEHINFDHQIWNHWLIVSIEVNKSMELGHCEFGLDSIWLVRKFLMAILSNHRPL